MLFICGMRVAALGQRRQPGSVAAGRSLETSLSTSIQKGALENSVHKRRLDLYFKGPLVCRRANCCSIQCKDGLLGRSSDGLHTCTKVLRHCRWSTCGCRAPSSSRAARPWWRRLAVMMAAVEVW